MIKRSLVLLLLSYQTTTHTADQSHIQKPPTAQPAAAIIPNELQISSYQEWKQEEEERAMQAALAAKRREEKKEAEDAKAAKQAAILLALQNAKTSIRIASRKALKPGFYKEKEEENEFYTTRFTLAIPVARKTAPATQRHSGGQRPLICPICIFTSKDATLMSIHGKRHTTWKQSYRK